ncbi:MAG: acyl-CoA dehydrogenase family protein [Burkholderiaceae bacterium]|nr:acyl-CoA dehydrogenase family protein [Burkholderiaceae bacterium]
MPVPRIEPCVPDEACEQLRLEVREFLAEALAGHPAVARAHHWSVADPEFSRRLGERGWIGMTWPARYGGHERSQLERYVVIEELLAAGAPVAAHWTADRQSGPLLIRFAPETLAPKIVPGIVRGETWFCIGLSESDTGSDLASVRTRATRSGDGWVLDGTKTWISNAGLADRYVIFARSGEAPGAKGISAFLVDAGTPGLDASERIPVIAPHPLGTLRLNGCRVGADRLIGAPGQGFAIAMGTLDLFRTTVGAAGLGFARRALDEATQRAIGRRMFGQTLADFQLTQVQVGDMATQIDAAALMVYRSAWTRDVMGRRVTREASMAKLYATEVAQKVIDGAVQLHGGLGVVTGSTVERLYREIRALRIYEGATEVLQLIVGARHLDAARKAAS